MDEVDFTDGPDEVAGVGTCLDGVAEEFPLGFGKGAADASEGEVGPKSPSIRVEAEDAALVFDGGLKIAEGGEVAAEADPEDAGVVGVGEDSNGAEAEAEGRLFPGGGLDGV